MYKRQVFTVPLTMVAALLIAVLLNSKIKGIVVYRTAFFFPYVASLVAVGDVYKRQVLCLSTDLFQDVLGDTNGGQEAVVVTSEGKRIASLYEPEGHREENYRVIRQLQQSGQDKGCLLYTSRCV